MGDRLLALVERLVVAVERAAEAHERIAAATERQAGVARAARAPRTPKRSAPIDEVTRQRAREMARKSGFVVDE